MLFRKYMYEISQECERRKNKQKKMCFQLNLGNFVLNYYNQTLETLK